MPITTALKVELAGASVGVALIGWLLADLGLGLAGFYLATLLALPYGVWLAWRLLP